MGLARTMKSYAMPSSKRCNIVTISSTIPLAGVRHGHPLFLTKHHAMVWTWRSVRKRVRAAWRSGSERRVKSAGRVWTIPATRMKMNREHRVPLSPWALGVLDALVQAEGSVFSVRVPLSSSPDPFSSLRPTRSSLIAAVRKAGVNVERVRRGNGRGGHQAVLRGDFRAHRRTDDDLGLPDGRRGARSRNYHLPNAAEPR